MLLLTPLSLDVIFAKQKRLCFHLALIFLHFSTMLSRVSLQQSQLMAIVDSFISNHEPFFMDSAILLSIINYREGLIAMGGWVGQIGSRF